MLEFIAINVPRGDSNFFSLPSLFVVATDHFYQRDVRCVNDKGAQSCSSLKQVRAGVQAGRDPGGRNQFTVLGGVLLAGFLLMVFSAYFVIEPSTTILGLLPATMCWALLY